MINMGIEIFATITDILFLIWFIPRFNGISIKDRPVALWWAAFLLAFQLIADHFLQGFDLLYALIVFLLALGFSFSLQKKKCLWQAFSALVYVMVVMLTSTLVYMVLSLFIDNADAIIHGSVSYLRPVYILLSKIVHLAFYRLLLFIFKKDQFLDLKNAIFSFLFTITTAIGLGTVIKIATLYDLVAIDFPVLIISVVLVVLNIILYLMIYQVQNLLQSKYALTLMQERMASEKSRIDEATVIWENIRKVKHDLKNHFMVIRGKLDAKDVQACKAYLTELYQTVETMGDLIQSGNSVIDYLINSKLSGLEGVQVLVSGYVGNYSDIDEIDLASILGNVLDNAIEAQKHVKKEKRIELHFLQKKSNRIILCKNTIGGSVLRNNMQLRSTKKSPELHGLGHQIVESKVNKYNGIIDYFEDEDMFGVQIMFPESNLYI